MDLGLAGRVALVTGASGGIGSAIAEALAAEGAVVWNFDREPPSGGASGVRFHHCDVASPASWEAAVAEAAGPSRRVDILVNNAGIRRDRISWRMTDAEWGDVLQVDLTGAFYGIRAVAPFLRERRWGRIVNISSINALRGKAGQANYAAAKAGLIGLTMACAREMGRDGITVNAVAPGMIDTGMLLGLDPAVVDTARAETVSGRLGQPHEIAATVSFLCSEAASHVTGAVLPVDGGQRL
jgi:3-oxoacyl-[acyl-carrier protein] reductase